ncbi:2-halobenzoate 1,2-dioxygenase large subunit [Legionella massiliensis]|uniref:2-halobenzoate 1,2-dioxygenase large subunit n=1 Tax=Legionella massiliensis TaxID=1034943 RepID=A0A078KVZ0_9GAMM|nr:SRPBCC family protein [Legionella massiliensis]CDZ77177.1 2-halobenzoate 1,2-dioxygenase large subunit [Legionella massiliensis]CEE12915.1 2-halobenzoate 1,2-dioxygenase large subunit [Legionella massiliensis]
MIKTNCYVNSDFYAHEQTLFDNKLNYVGHELMVPNLDDYRVLENNAEILFHNKNGFEIISNICRHHQAIMLEGQGNSKKIICPIHRWNFSNEGKLLLSPQFDVPPCLHLPTKKLSNWNGLLFSGEQSPLPVPVDDQATILASLDFSDYAYSNSVSFNHEFNWKIFIDNYLDDYHVQPFHPGLRNLVDCTKIYWEFGKNYSIQKVGAQRNLLKSGPLIHSNWHKAILDYRNNRPPEFGAIWFLLYPNIMVEHYPEMLTISVVLPDGPGRCINMVDFFYPKQILQSNTELVELSQLAYEETAREDEIICERIFKGKKLLVQQGLNDSGIVHMPSEAGIPYFHQYLSEQLGPVDP